MVILALVSNLPKNLTTALIDVTSTLATLVIDGIASNSSLLDSYVVLYAAFISSLHKIVGVEFGENRIIPRAYMVALISIHPKADRKSVV